MRNKNTPKDFQVALLMEDVTEAKAISDGLREIGIFAHYYQDLDELWVSLNSYTPDLCIVDVKRMSQGTLLFKQHLKVKNHSLKFAFYYKDSTQMLLNSTFGLNHYGFIRAELNIQDQLKSILHRRNEELKLIEQIETLDGRVERLKSRSSRLTVQQEKDSFTISQSEKVNKFISDFGRVDSVENFINRSISSFSEMDGCIDFGIYKLNSTNQKLVSPKAKKMKYRNLPDLWLSSVCNEGITNYAIEMAYDVCYGLMDDELTALRIQGTFNNPDLLIIGNFDQEKTKNYNWNAIETKLNSEYRRAVAISNTSPEKASHHDSIFETFKTLDNIQFHQSDSKHRHVLIDFSSLVTLVKQRSSNRFHWDAFAKEFNAELSDSLHGDFRISNYGVECFVVSIEKKYIESDFHKVKEFVGGFQFWRYFEDSSLVVSSDLAPDVRLIAPSSVNIIRQAQDGFNDIMETPSVIKPSKRRQIEV